MRMWKSQQGSGMASRWKRAAPQTAFAMYIFWIGSVQSPLSILAPVGNQNNTLEMQRYCTLMLSSINQSVNTLGWYNKYQARNNWTERKYLLGYHFLCLNLQRNLSNLPDRGSFLLVSFLLIMTHCSAAICLETDVKYGLLSSCISYLHSVVTTGNTQIISASFPLYVCNQETITGNKIN